MAIEQNLSFAFHSAVASGTAPDDSITWIEENVLVETPKPSVEPPGKEGVPHDTENNLGEVRGVKNEGGTEASSLSIGSINSRWSDWWKTTVWNLKVVMPLLLSDLLTITAVLVIASTLAASYLATVGQPTLSAKVCVLLALILGRLAEGLYPGVGLNNVIELRKQTVTATVVFLLLGLSWFATGHFNSADAFFLLCAYIPCVIGLPFCRYLTQMMLGKTSWWGFPVLVFGCGPTARRLLLAMRNSPSRGLRPIGCVGLPSDFFQDHRGNGKPVQVDDFLGHFEEAPRLIAEHNVQWVIAAMPESSPKEVARLVSQYASRASHRLLTTGISDFPYLWQSVRDCGGQVGIEIRDGLLMPSRQVLKRIFDSCAVVVGGLLISPLLIGISLAIKLGSPGPIFYGQKRIGYGGKELTMWKFRSMFVNADSVLRDYLDNDPEMRKEWERTHKLQNDPRITRVGRILRATSLDELPQLWNVLQGEMSLVGPRPIVDDVNYDREYVTDYPEAYQLYLRVRPGLTGLWQVAGRRDRNYYLRPQLDAYYVRNWSIWLDLFLLTRTIKTVLRREGA